MVGIPLEIDSNLGQIIYMVDIEILDYIFFSFFYWTRMWLQVVQGMFFYNIPEGLSMEK